MRRDKNESAFLRRPTEPRRSPIIQLIGDVGVNLQVLSDQLLEPCNSHVIRCPICSIFNASDQQIYLLCLATIGHQSAVSWRQCVMFGVPAELRQLRYSSCGLLLLDSMRPPVGPGAAFHRTCLLQSRRSPPPNLPPPPPVRACLSSEHVLDGNGSWALGLPGSVAALEALPGANTSRLRHHTPPPHTAARGRRGGVYTYCIPR